jgi:hypothetical protein
VIANLQPGPGGVLDGDEAAIRAQALTIVGDAGRRFVTFLAGRAIGEPQGEA